MLGTRFAPEQPLRPVQRTGLLSLLLQQRYELPGRPFGLGRAVVRLRRATRKRGLAPLGLLRTRPDPLDPQRRSELAKRARDCARYYAPRRVVESTGGPLAHLVSLVDDIGFRGIHALRDYRDHRSHAALIRTYFRIAGMFPPWVQRTLDYVCSRWLRAFSRTQRVLRYIESNAFDVYTADYVPSILSTGQ